MTHDTGMLRAKLRRSLDNIGHNNGHACPETRSNIDPVLHELYIASECVTYFKTRFEEAKAAAMAVGDGLDAAVQSVVDTNTGTSVTLASGDIYTLTADISKPATRLDATALRNFMQTELGISADDVARAFDECSNKNAPAKKIKVAAR